MEITIWSLNNWYLDQMQTHRVEFLLDRVSPWFSSVAITTIRVRKHSPIHFITLNIRNEHETLFDRGLTNWFRE